MPMSGKKPGKPRPQAKEFFYRDRGKLCDAELHEPILAEGDHEAAVAVSRRVMKRLGIKQDRIDKLLGPE
jgi:hypothetical protein